MRCNGNLCFLSIFLVLILAITVLPVSAQTYTVVVDFHGQSPQEPAGGPGAVQGRDGNYYGLSLLGGAHDLGSIFQVTPSGTLTTIYSFDGTVGQYPNGGLTLGTDGNLYGTANRGGSAGFGSIYKITTAGIITTLHTFTNTGDGTNPATAPILGTDGNFYGTTTGLNGGTMEASATVYKLTPAGVFTVIHTLNPSTEGNNLDFLTQGADGSFYGLAALGGSGGQGTIFKVTAAGAFTVLHTFTGTDGEGGDWMVQGSDGAFYGTAYQGGTSGAGVLFKITSTGIYTKLHDFNGNTDGTNPVGTVAMGTDGNFYGVTYTSGASNGGTIFRFTKTGAFTKLWDFNCNSPTQFGCNPQTGMAQATSGLFYGSTLNAQGGVFYSLNVSLQPFLRLQQTSGKLGTKVGILGQGFNSSSIVKFNGVQATSVQRQGSTFLQATVPAGASDGTVTVKTGATTLTSSQTFIVHNSWGIGTAMPTGVQWPAAGVLGSQIYVVGGYTASVAVTNNAIYNPATNTWSSGAALPSANAQAASAVVSNTLYLFGGSSDGGGTVSNAVWAYSPATHTWSAKAAMPTARCSAVAVAEKGIIYVIGGFNGGRLNTVEGYNPATDTWTVEAPLLTGKSEISAGLIGTTIVAADGFSSPGGVTGDNESYNASTNTWTTLLSDSVHRNGACAGAIGGNLYAAGGNDNSNNAFVVNEAFNLAANTWTSLTTMPQTVTDAGAAVFNGQLYCFGGSSFANAFHGTVFNNVQIYQP